MPRNMHEDNYWVSTRPCLWLKPRTTPWDILPKTKLIQEPSKQAAAQQKQHAAQRKQPAAKRKQPTENATIDLLLEACHKLEDDELNSRSRKHPSPAWVKKTRYTQADFDDREPLMCFANFAMWPLIPRP